jgi:aryl-alcohol dehydrogenase-like predicted oxidoreductase
LVELCEKEQIAFLPWAPIQGLDVPIVGEIADRHGASPWQVALAWLLARSPAMLVIPGTGSTSHLEDNVAAARVGLGADDIAALDGAGGLGRRGLAGRVRSGVRRTSRRGE